MESSEGEVASVAPEESAEPRAEQDYRKRLRQSEVELEELVEEVGDELAEYFVLERYFGFTDSTIAIAITLLITPLLNSISEFEPAVRKHDDLANVTEWYQQNATSLCAFVYSFFLVLGFWRAHNMIGSRMERMSTTFMILNACFLMVVVYLPVATALVMSADFKLDFALSLNYLLPLIFAKFILLLIALVVRSDRNMWAPGHPNRILRYFNLAVATGVCDTTILLIVIGLSFTVLSFYALAFLFLTPLVFLPLLQRHWPKYFDYKGKWLRNAESNL